MLVLPFCCPLIILLMLTFCIFAYLDCKQHASLRVKIAWRCSRAQTQTGGTSVPYNYSDIECLFVLLPPNYSSISSAVFHFQKGHWRIYPLISILFGFFRPSLPLIDLCRAPGSTESNTWLITSPVPYFIDSLHVQFICSSSKCTTLRVDVPACVFANMTSSTCAWGESLCTSSPALACTYTCVDISEGPVQGSGEHAVPSFTATQPQLAARFTAVCVGVCVFVCRCVSCLTTGM